MKAYQVICPEIITGLGEKNLYDHTQQKIVKLHINLENWWGDDLLWIFPEAVVTEPLKKDLEQNIFTGFNFEEILVSKSIYFETNFKNTLHNKTLPTFYWMKILGQENKDDFFIKEGNLWVSDRALQYLQTHFSLNNCQINPTENEFDDFIMSLILRDSQNDW